MPETLTLSGRLDTGASPGLHASLLELQGKPCAIDAAGVTFLGGLCFQILLAARRDWQAAGLTLTVGPVSEAMERGLQLMGAPLDTWQGEEMAAEDAA